MKYDFDALVERRGTDSVKWNVGENELPMWIADMDFQAAKPIREALERRVQHGVFGYCTVPDKWYEAYISWWSARHGHELQREWLTFCTGVVPAISSIVRKLTTPAEKVLIQSPVYNMFFNSVLNNGRVLIDSPLVYADGAYSIDFADLESKLADPQTTMMIVCNPHNPVGRIWDRETLAHIGELCARHGVTVISDEIHCDLTAPGHEYVPFSAASETCRNIGISCMAPSKTFSIPAIHTACISVPNPLLRSRVRRALNTDEIAEPNAFAVDAAVAALTEGGEWLDQLREYVAENRRFAEDYVKSEIPQLRIVRADATYLLWVDCTALSGDLGGFAAFLRADTGLYVSPGLQYGETGRGFLRINIACPRSRVADGMDRLKKGVNDYIAKEN